MALFSWLSRSRATDGSDCDSEASTDVEEDAPTGVRQRVAQQTDDPTGDTAPPEDDTSSSRALSLFAHNATSFACKCCTLVTQDLQALRRHRRSSHRRVTFDDHFFAQCACGASFPARIAATKHATQCQTLTSTNPEPAEELEPVPPSETRTDVATVTVCTPARAFAPVLPNLHEAGPPDEPMEPQDPPPSETPDYEYQDGKRRRLNATNTVTVMDIDTSPTRPSSPATQFLTYLIASTAATPAPSPDVPMTDSNDSSDHAAVRPPDAPPRASRQTSKDRRDRSRRRDQDSARSAPDSERPPPGHQTTSSAPTAPTPALPPTTSTQTAPANSGTWLLRFDGACKGNPGAAGAGAHLSDPSGATVWTLALPLPGKNSTNNTTEYSALVAGLQSAVLHHVQHLDIEGDSNLIIAQVKGEYGVTNPRLKRLRRQARDLLTQIRAYSINHIDRLANKHADHLANQGLRRTLPRVQCATHGTNGADCWQVTLTNSTATPTTTVTGRSRVTQHSAQSEEACVEHLSQGLVTALGTCFYRLRMKSNKHSSLLPASCRATTRFYWSPAPTGTAQKTPIV